MKTNDKKTGVLLVIGMLFLVIILVGSAYAWYHYRKAYNAFTLTSNSISAVFTPGSSNEINMRDAYPISDEFALSNLENLSYVDFTVSSNTTTLNETVRYEIYLTEKNGNTLNSDYVKVYLTDNNDNEIVEPLIYGNLPFTSYPGDSTTGKIIYEDKNIGQFTKSYRLYAWIDKDFEDNSISRNFSFYVNLYAYNDTNDGMYTITFNPNGGTVSPTTKKVNVGNTYGKLPTPVRSNYRFDGWYAEPGFVNLVTADTELSGTTSKTLYAKWAPSSISDIIFASASNTIYLHYTTATSIAYSGFLKSISYASNNTSVATVDNEGVVTGNGPGIATITATLIDNDDKITRVTVDIEVIKVPSAILSYTPPSGITCGDNDEECGDIQLILDKIADMVH